MLHRSPKAAGDRIRHNHVTGELIYMTRAWHKEKSESRQKSNPWPPEHRAGALSTELRELMESKVILTEFICDTKASCILLGFSSTVEVIMSSDK